MRLAIGLLPLSFITAAAIHPGSEDPAASAPVVGTTVTEAPVVAEPAATSPAPSLVQLKWFYGDECCAVCDSITSNFNGTKIPGGDYLWLNAIVKVSGNLDSTSCVNFTCGKVTCTIDGEEYDVTLPDAKIVITDQVDTASTSFDCDRRTWTTIVPRGYTGNIFLSGALVYLKKGLPGGLNPVVWSGRFSSDRCGLSFQWKWAAAVYTCGSDCEDDLGVKPIDGDKANPYHNSDHAGTPENFKDCVTGGARGGGGSNFTGSYSGTSTAKCD